MLRNLHRLPHHYQAIRSNKPKNRAAKLLYCTGLSEDIFAVLYVAKNLCHPLRKRRIPLVKRAP